MTNRTEEEANTRGEITDTIEEAVEQDEREQMRMDEMTDEERVWLEDEMKIIRVMNLVEWAGLEDEYKMSTNYITGKNL